ncbi:MAG: hypothetical protein A2X61_01580 [Ignavibacteria bacterium GWB2_35_12]|nr:MAG: hypothetical protein A2X63_05270 [Ignavibacteria bacterium GWA2_35_8]OGU41862.1 MAG: hypothetical protein A2X61_01580 [Ignavibacteria bacterium GWB2_35_12]OGU86155.1 MAG: hypothetical protein A2220_17310 [Ignavibacteria bacterium RIFOXYA2_FULL_35_10]OGV23490.1 MAG: hypothetical protein A2475_06065 [Ignavibacteria bacterium RIFOXYC2_FULL_35_21]
MIKLKTFLFFLVGNLILYSCGNNLIQQDIYINDSLKIKSMPVIDFIDVGSNYNLDSIDGYVHLWIMCGNCDYCMFLPKAYAKFNNHIFKDPLNSGYVGDIKLGNYSMKFNIVGKYYFGYRYNNNHNDDSLPYPDKKSLWEIIGNPDENIPEISDSFYLPSETYFLSGKLCDSAYFTQGLPIEWLPDSSNSDNFWIYIHYNGIKSKQYDKNSDSIDRYWYFNIIDNGYYNIPFDTLDLPKAGVIEIGIKRIYQLLIKKNNLKILYSAQLYATQEVFFNRK